MFFYFLQGVLFKKLFIEKQNVSYSPILRSYTTEELSDLANQHEAEFIVYGDYNIEGSIKNQNASIQLKIWGIKSKQTLTYNFKTPTDADIFDAIDDMMKKILKTILDEEMKISYLNIDITQITKERLGLYINDRLVKEVVEDNFRLNLKVLSDNDYKVVLNRMSNGKDIFQSQFSLKQKETKDIVLTNNRINMIKDGGFEETKEIESIAYSDKMQIKQMLNKIGDKWNIGLMRGNVFEQKRGVAKASVENGKCRVTITSQSINDFGIVFQTFPFKLEKEKKYLLSFDAGSSKPQWIVVNVGSLYGVWDNEPTYSGPLRAYVDKDMRTFTLVFRMKNFTDIYGKIGFWLGTCYNNSEVWFDNVFLELEE